ncbi:unnamed protein product, partial [Ixodes persulcatus]
MALSEDNSLLVSGSEDGRVLLWSTQSTPIELLGTLRGHSSYVTHCVVHGNYVVTGSADGTLKKWSIVDAKCVHTFEGHGARVNRVACTADLILSTSHDKTAAAWRFNADLELQVRLLLSVGAEARRPDTVDRKSEWSRFYSFEDIDFSIVRRLLRQVASSNKSAVSGPKERGSLGSNGENGEGNSSSYEGTSGDDDSDSESDSTSDRITVFRGHTKSVFPVIFVPADNMPGSTKETEDIVITGSHDFTARTWGLYSGECLKASCMMAPPPPPPPPPAHDKMLYDEEGGEEAPAKWKILEEARAPCPPGYLPDVSQTQLTYSTASVRRMRSSTMN